MTSRLLKSTAFRMAVLVGITLACASLVASVMAFAVVTGELERRMDQSIFDAFSVISAAYGNGDQTDLVDAVSSHAEASLGHMQVYGLSAADGTLLAGDVKLDNGYSGWQTVSGNELGLGDGDSENFRVFSGSVGPNVLVVGSSFAQARQLGQLSALTLAVSSLVTIALVVAVGSLIALRAQRRIDTIAQTMQRIGRGELSARIPLGRVGDDIDHLAQQVNDALDRLSALVESMRQVSVDIAHDLKTPLNRMAIGIDAALSKEMDAAGLKSVLDDVQVEARRIGATFDALLRIAQIEAGARRSRFQRQLLSPILHRLMDIYGDVADESGQQLVVNVAEDLPPINGDTELLTQLFANLIENAIRHCPPGVSIEVSSVLSRDTLTIICRDTGPGIPVDEQERVFDRLYRLEKSRTTPGHGLGLTMVKAIAELHGARIWLANGDPGLFVHIAFPRMAP